MNWIKMLIGLGLIAVSIILIIATDGVLLPIFAPVALFGVSLCGVKLE